MCARPCDGRGGLVGLAVEARHEQPHDDTPNVLVSRSGWLVAMQRYTASDVVNPGRRSVPTTPRLERLRCRHRGAEHWAGRRSCSLHFPSAGRQAAQDGAEPAGTPALPTQVRTVRRWGGPEAAREHHQPGNGHQTPGLATAARKRDHVGTKPRVTGRNQCPTRFVEMAAEQDKRIRQGITRTGGDAQYKTTDLAVGGSNPSRRAKRAGQTDVDRSPGCGSYGLVGSRSVWWMIRSAAGPHASMATVWSYRCTAYGV
jgi:hypothetical protein